MLLISFVQEESGGRPLSSENDVFHHFPFILLLDSVIEDISGIRYAGVVVIIKSVGALLFPSCTISFYYDAFYIVYSQFTIQPVGDGVDTDLDSGPFDEWCSSVCFLALMKKA